MLELAQEYGEDLLDFKEKVRKISEKRVFAQQIS
jgi:hypothetical protein